MATVTIKYSELEDTSSYAKKLSKNLDSYADEIQKKITSPINGLPGNDNRGYANTASASANRKIKELQSNSYKFNTFSQNVERFVSTAKAADNAVAKSIKSTASSYVGERSAWEGFCDFLWNAVCVDFFNGTTAGRFIKDCATTAWSKVTSVSEKVYDWFKHGDGKYVWNIVSGVVATIGAIAGAISAVATAIAGGPFIVVAVAIIAAAAAIVGAVITTVNSSVKIYNNIKAISSDDPGVSRYLGNINGFSDAVAKYDMGDAEDNAAWKKYGQVINSAETVCDTIGFINGVANLGAVKSDITGRVTGYKLDRNNVMYNIRKKTGFDFEKNKYTLKGMFSVDKVDQTSSWYANENGYGGFKWLMNRHTGTQNFINGIFNGAEAVNRTMSTFKKVDSVYSSVKEGYDFSSTSATLKSIESIGYTVIDTYSAMGNFEVFGGINKLTIKPYTTGKSISDTFKLWMCPIGA